ncbi:hypothetical protein [Aureivirga sp. CE67]|uniref:hypothetical protein n=1 Tax=Aureivirga sp. CE67 TaxID=1788983 RepID=UPI0018CAA103|nr:hypothetical protein [Aureivirga sp. CE67]
MELEVLELILKTETDKVKYDTLYSLKEEQFNDEVFKLLVSLLDFSNDDKDIFLVLFFIIN